MDSIIQPPDVKDSAGLTLEENGFRHLNGGTFRVPVNSEYYLNAHALADRNELMIMYPNGRRDSSTPDQRRWIVERI